MSAGDNVIPFPVAGAKVQRVPTPPRQTRPGFDVHRYSAAVRLGCHSRDVSATERSRQKAANYWIFYGGNEKAARELYDSAAAKYDQEQREGG